MTASPEAATPDSQAQAPIVIHRLYIKDLSFEAPNTPETFTQEWKPSMQLDINTQNSKVDNQIHEVILNLTVTVKSSSNNKVAFLIELKYAGLFGLNNIPDAQLKHVLGIFCPSVLYPYAREVITDIVNRASFPQLILAPINFEALYAQQSQQGKGELEDAVGTSTGSVENTIDADKA